jgi:hypothetical protein
VPLAAVFSLELSVDVFVHVLAGLAGNGQLVAGQHYAYLLAVGKHLVLEMVATGLQHRVGLDLRVEGQRERAFVRGGHWTVGP